MIFPNNVARKASGIYVITCLANEMGPNEALQAAARLFWTGRKHTEAALANMRAAKKDKLFPQSAHDAALVANLGHHRRHSVETRAKIAAKAMGREMSAANRAALVKSFKGVKWTPERIAKRVATFHANRAAAAILQKATDTNLSLELT